MPELKHTLAYRAVAGAVKNALDGHPDWKVPPAFAQSVAKRAAGTLMAHAAPEVLASARASRKPGRRAYMRRPGATGPVGNTLAPVAAGAVRELTDRARIKRAVVEIGKLAAETRRAGNMVCYHAVVECLRIIARNMNEGA